MVRHKSDFCTFFLLLIFCIHLGSNGLSHFKYQLSTLENQHKTREFDIIKANFIIEHHGAIIRGDTTKKEIALVFTGDEFADGAEFIAKVLKEQSVKASFFLTGNFYRNPLFKKYIENLEQQGHYLGAHSDQHLLYCDWNNRDSLLVTKDQFISDLEANFKEMDKFGRSLEQARIFIPPFEWYNQKISEWCKEIGLILINFTPGTLSHADYTVPSMDKKYVASNSIYNTILHYEETKPCGLNGFILLIHIGSHPERKDKFYFYLPRLLIHLKELDYSFKRIDKLLIHDPLE